MKRAALVALAARAAGLAVMLALPWMLPATAAAASGVAQNALPASAPPPAQSALPALARLATLPLADDFAKFDGARWAVEAEDDAGSAVYVKEHALYLDSARGLTVWLREKLAGHYEITFNRTVLGEGQPHDRLSDLNLFWQARLDDGANVDHRFSRSGKFEDYDSLRLWYAGIGGNGNTTTRLRYYDGSGARKLLQEYLTPPYLLVANHAYHVRLVVDAAGSALYVDGARYFHAPPASADGEGGYFAFRSTKSRQKITDFAVRALP